MPIFLLNAIRTLILFIVQSGAIVAIQALLSPMIDAAKKAVRDTFGLSEDDATTYVANMVLDILELAGISILVFKSRVPLQIADKLGFAKKGYVRGALPAKVSTGANAPGAMAKAAGNAVKVPTIAESATLISVVKAGGNGVKNVMGFLEKRLNTVFFGFLVAGGWLDFANWETGAYSQSMQKILEQVSFGLIRPDEDWRKSKTASDDVFGKVFETFRISGATAINDPFKRQSVAFTRDNMLDLIDQLGAKSLLATGKADTKSLLAAAQVLIVFDLGKAAAITGTQMNTTSGTVGGTGASVTATVNVSAIPKVFTGVVAQGVVGQGLVFTPRPDDMIESAAELRTAAANNLAPYLNTLLGKIVYEVKVVSSIITKEGFKQTGTTQQIQTGTYSNGQPKYKTVTNKFATLVVYALTDKGTRAKLTTIVLGPTNSAKLTVAQTDLRALEEKLPDLVTTTDIGEIKGIATSNPVTIVPPQKEKEVKVEVSDGYEKRASVTITNNEDLAKYKALGYKIEKNPKNAREVLGYKPTGKESGASAPDTGPAVSAPVSSAPKPGASATTLSDWYQAQGKSLPSVEARSKIYAELGLGQASYYTGSAEQNTKLLSALKANA